MLFQDQKSRKKVIFERAQLSHKQRLAREHRKEGNMSPFIGYKTNDNDCIFYVSPQGSPPCLTSLSMLMAYRPSF